MLFQNGSFGHAYSLAVLGLEELSKSLISFDKMIGIYDLENAQDYSRVKNLISAHKSKHYVAINTVLTSLLIEWYEDTTLKEEFEKIRRDYINDTISDISFQNKLINLIEKDEDNESSENFLDFFDYTIEFYENDRMIEDLKQNGLYIDFDFKTGEIQGPFNFAKGWVEERLDSIEHVILFYQVVFETLMDRKLQNKYIKPLYDIFPRIFIFN